MLTSSIVIPTRDRPQQLVECLRAIRENEGDDVELVVVDSAPEVIPAEAVAAEWGARYVREKAVGASRSRNTGARAATGEVVLFIDDDAIPEAGWRSALVAEFDDARVMAAAGAVRSPGGSARTSRADQVAMWMGLSFSGGDSRRVIDRSVPEWFEMAAFGGVGIGPNMAMRRSAFDAWAGFDHRLGPGASLPGAEEPYAFFSLIDRGHRVVYSPNARVRHPCPQHSVDALRKRYIKSLTISSAYFTFLWIQEPRYRHRTLRYLFQGIRGVRRSWREQPAPPPFALASTWSKTRAYLAGVLLGYRVSRRPLTMDASPIRPA